MASGMTPLTTPVIGSKKVHEHLEASNSELETLIVKLGVPKTKAILLQQEELIKFKGPGEKHLTHFVQRTW